MRTGPRRTPRHSYSGGGGGKRGKQQRRGEIMCDDGAQKAHRRDASRTAAVTAQAHRAAAALRWEGPTRRCPLMTSDERRVTGDPAAAAAEAAAVMQQLLRHWLGAGVPLPEPTSLRLLQAQPPPLGCPQCIRTCRPPQPIRRATGRRLRGAWPQHWQLPQSHSRQQPTPAVRSLQQHMQH